MFPLWVVIAVGFTSFIAGFFMAALLRTGEDDL
jgi:hypothetical protein